MRGESLGSLPESDYQHIAGEWPAYTMHLKESYPFLFSLAARINPFNPNPSPVVSG